MDKETVTVVNSVNLEPLLSKAEVKVSICTVIKVYSKKEFKI